MEQQSALAQDASRFDTPMRRVARNIIWLVLGEGLTRTPIVVANILLARFLTSTRYGVLALAQTWASYAAMAADLGINPYGQAEAARADNRRDLTKLAEEIIPFRVIAGFLALAAFAAVVFYAAPFKERATFLAAGLYIPATAIGVDWLLRGRERFDLIPFASGTGATLFLFAVVLVRGSRHALFLDVLAWALSYCVMATIYLGFLRKVTGTLLRLSFVPARWMVHIRQSLFVFLSAVFLNSYCFLPLVLLGWLRSAGEVGAFAAPYRLVINFETVSSLLPKAFYPVGAGLFHDSPEQFHQSRRSLAMLMLMAGLPVSVVGCAMAGPAMRLIFGHDFATSGPVFSVIIWLLPLFMVWSIHDATVLSTGFYRVHVLASMAGGIVALVSGVLLVPRFGAVGAGMSQLAGEAAMVAALMLISRKVHGEFAVPGLPEFSKLLLLNLLLAAAALYLPARLGWMTFAAIAPVGYISGSLALGLVNPSSVMTWTSCST